MSKDRAAKIANHIDSHAKISASFLGPKAENAELLKKYLVGMVERLESGRKSYFPSDQNFITSQFIETQAFQERSASIASNLDLLLESLDKWAVPFWSPRYSAHMTVDQSLPAILGYVATLFYNPNNVAFEASPFTTLLETEVGKQLSEMVGYNLETGSNLPVAWGHITCDGTVANLESLWVSRNLKYYPLSLRDAMAVPGSALSGIASTFKVTTATGQEKLFSTLETWDLLNLTVSTVLNLQDTIVHQYNIDAATFNAEMEEHLVQTVGMRDLLDRWQIKNEPVLLVPSTKHYSWPKSAAIAGLGSKSVIDIPIDISARMNIDLLRAKLDQCLAESRTVYEVVAVIGTTEEGTVDLLPEILALRDEYRAKGLSFVVHADAAWGGYFSTMLEPEGAESGYLIGLRTETEERLRALKDCDSITIDPHKSGYVPYPAGSLVYKDGRMRYLVTWTAPYLDGNSTDVSIGVYGVEGSKPGAAASAAFLAHEVIGLHPEGHGALLREVSYTCRRFSSHWAAMSTDTDPFIVVPFNPLPSETDPNSTPEKVEAEKEFIRTRIWNKSDAELLKDEEALKLLNQLGSELNINIFACNFRNADGSINKDVKAANDLNRALFELFSITEPKENPKEIPFWITSTTFTEKDYGECMRDYKKRLGLEGEGDLFVLRNVVMSPFTTTHDFVGELADVFEAALLNQVEAIREKQGVVPSAKPQAQPKPQAKPATKIGGGLLGTATKAGGLVGAVAGTAIKVASSATLPLAALPASRLQRAHEAYFSRHFGHDISGHVHDSVKVEWQGAVKDLRNRMHRRP
ncbi:hypothetical protein AX16_007924 [Volvariella volvacea WC 439]|nr:hypothetical protein AX16_007924 [Volvariella volvacea WC 439]